jgi:hypothetical protein
MASSYYFLPSLPQEKNENGTMTGKGGKAAAGTSLFHFKWFQMGPGAGGSHL